jgi:hypothetical protein
MSSNIKQKFPPKLHNKSNKSSLSVSYSSRAERRIWWNLLLRPHRKHRTLRGLIQGSNCILMANKKGTINYQRRKVCYGYQLVAIKKFGLNKIRKVTSCKNDGDLTISHLCGTRNCINSKHIILEPKHINDERTHCHFCMQSAYERGGWDNVQTFLDLGCCRHKPVCGSVNIANLIKEEAVEEENEEIDYEPESIDDIFKTSPHDSEDDDSDFLPPTNFVIRV